ncbi:hypothetical protein D3C87_1797570 [compost metagenome]|jgi:hypothetical protein
MYREIYNGSHVEGEEGEDTFVTYLGVVDEYGDAKFNISEKDDARDTHRTLEEILNRGKQDPGSLVRKTL